MESKQIREHGDAKEIDWNKPQLVICNANDLILLTTGEHEERTFSSVTLRAGDDPNTHNGSLESHWVKKCFKLYNGEISLKNS